MSRYLNEVVGDARWFAPSLLLPSLLSLVFPVLFAAPVSAQDDGVAAEDVSEVESGLGREFDEQISPLLTTYCVDCHNADLREAGIRVDDLNGLLEDRHLRRWEGVGHQIRERAMPPEDEAQPSDEERARLESWIERAIHVSRMREPEKNGSTRRLTVQQYRNTLRDLLLLGDDLTDILPADSVSKDGFVNNEQTLLLSPLLLETYFEIAEEALDRCLVDPSVPPVVQSFRMDLGEGINPQPYPDPLILGALSHLLDNDDFIVTEPVPEKPFGFEPFRMRTQYRFIEGYEGNATVRGWRDFDSIYHAVFACVRGTDGYPKGRAYEALPEGLALRPAIPSAELFQIESTYGPRANFKISLRELPDRGRFRVKVTAARYDDGLLLEPGVALAEAADGEAIESLLDRDAGAIAIESAGVYQVELYQASSSAQEADGSRLSESLVGYWEFEANESAEGSNDESADDSGAVVAGEYQLEGEARLVETPFGQGLSVDGQSSAARVSSSSAVSIGSGSFTVAAWIHPRKLQQAGIVTRGGYGYTHGWVFDMPGNNGVLRLETARSGNQANGTIQSRPGVIRAGQWQHVAVTVSREGEPARLYVNGEEVGSGQIGAEDLDNPAADLLIGRVAGANLFDGLIDEVRLYSRALDREELLALVAPGASLIQPLPEQGRFPLRLHVGSRSFSGDAGVGPFLAVRLEEGTHRVSAEYPETVGGYGVRLVRLAETSEVYERFLAFERRSPLLGVHLGLRRDCGSTLAPVEQPRVVDSIDFQEFVFEGAIANYPSPEVEKNNVNYLAGIREIGVRSEYTDGRDRPRLVIKSVEFEGPFYETWPPVAHSNLLPESKLPMDSVEYAESVLRDFASRAFRRPVTDDEASLLLDVWESGLRATGDVRESYKQAMQVVLTSPQFLFLIETSETPEPEPLGEWELASKLSYFLWNTAPDERLLELAERGELREALDGELTRLIADERFEQSIEPFVSQWLRLEKFDVVELDRDKFPDLTREVKAELRREPIEFVKHLVRHNLPVARLVDSEFVLANEVVASYYDLGGKLESGFEFEPIVHEDEHLGGVLTQAAILSGLSDGRESHPVKRGAWFARSIIDEPPADPPPNVPGLPEDDDSGLTIREKLERHRNQKGCVKCHEGIDPWGLPFEEYDAGGRFSLGPSVDAVSQLPGEVQVEGVRQLKAYLEQDYLDQVAFSFMRHVATYAVGRTLSYSEVHWLRNKCLEYREAGYPTQDLVRAVVQSRLFLEK